jgi:hypothetical protein
VKKAYTTPRLVTHGTISDITLTPPKCKDPNPCPPDKFKCSSCGPHS